MLRKDFAGHRDELIISTKAGFRMWDGPCGEWGSRKYLLASLDRSLKRLGLDYVDIFYHHRPDPETLLHRRIGAANGNPDLAVADAFGLQPQSSRILRTGNLSCPTLDLLPAGKKDHGSAVNPPHITGPASTGTVARLAPEYRPGLLRNYGPASAEYALGHLTPIEDARQRQDNGPQKQRKSNADPCGKWGKVTRQKTSKRTATESGGRRWLAGRWPLRRQR